MTSSIPDLTIEHNIEFSKKEGLECGYFYHTHKPYHTYTGNRSAVETQIYHAVVKGNKLYNKILVKKITTNLRLNFSDTKNTPETHEKKVEKHLKNYHNIKKEIDIINQSNIPLLQESCEK